MKLLARAGNFQMASAFSHAVAALSIGTCCSTDRKRQSACEVAGAICSVIPDVDVIGFRFGIHYGDFWGHAASRIAGVAALLASIVTLPCSARSVRDPGRFACSLFVFGDSQSRLA